MSVHVHAQYTWPGRQNTRLETTWEGGQNVLKDSDRKKPELPIKVIGSRVIKSCYWVIWALSLKKPIRVGRGTVFSGGRIGNILSRGPQVSRTKIYLSINATSNRIFNAPRLRKIVICSQAVQSWSYVSFGRRQWRQPKGSCVAIAANLYRGGRWSPAKHNSRGI